MLSVYLYSKNNNIKKELYEKNIDIYPLFPEQPVQHQSPYQCTRAYRNLVYVYSALCDAACAISLKHNASQKPK